MGTPGVPLDKGKILQAIHDKRGIIEHAAAELGCIPKTIYNWMKDDEDVATAVKEARENADKERIDKNQILKAKAYKSAEKLLDKADPTLTIFTLKTLCGFKEGLQDRTLNITLNERPYPDKQHNDSVQVSM